MKETNILIKILDWLLYNTPCWLWWHFYTRKLQSWERISLSWFENKEYTCEKCWKKTIL